MQHYIVIHHLSLNLIKYPLSGWVDLIGPDWCAVARCDVCDVESGTVQLVQCTVSKIIHHCVSGLMLTIALHE